MFCNITQRKFSEFSASLQDAAMQERTPFEGAFELTYRCNLACCHCYCNLGLNDAKKSEELTTKEVKRLLDEAADAGCLWLLLTGGEVLIREDFSEIYLYALKKGMIAEVFTNATLIEDKIAGLFAEFPPIGIDVSIYGSEPSLHDSITHVKGSFNMTMAGLSRLKRQKVRFSLKTMLMTLNFSDLGGMRKLAQDLQAEFHYDTLISPRLGGGLSPAEYRLDPDRMVSCDIKEEQDFKDCENVFDNFWSKDTKEISSCGAGIFAFNINPYGILSPCTMYLSFQYPLRQMPFKEAWNNLVSDQDKKKKDFISDECKNCTMLLMCPQCAAWAEMEAKGLNKKVGYLCGYAKHLEKEFFNKKEGGGL